MSNCPAIGQAVAQIPAIESLSRTYCAIGQRPSSSTIDHFTQCCRAGDNDIQVDPLLNGCYQWCQLPDSYFAKKHAGANVTQNFIDCVNNAGGYSGSEIQCNTLGVVSNLQTSAAPAMTATWWKVSGVVALLGSVMLL